jgi:tRNA(fMet)-specific endonuclease VapC
VLVLDTDVLTIAQYGSGPLFERLSAGLRAANEAPAATIISFEEQLRGWLAQIARSRRAEQQLAAYRRLQQLLTDFREYEVLPFTPSAYSRFESLRREHRRLGTMDLKIAAIILEQDATLVTRNTSDFAAIRGLRVVDLIK